MLGRSSCAVARVRLSGCAGCVPPRLLLSLVRLTVFWQAASGKLLFMTTWLSWVLPLIPLLIGAVAVHRSKDLATHAKSELQHGQARRLVHYVALMGWRTAVLYFLLNWLQGLAQPAEGTACAYSHWRPGGRCRENFDFADHVVLYVVHYVVVAASEISAALRVPLHGARRLSIASSVALCAAASHGTWRTASWFHTRAESTAGLVVAFGFGAASFHASSSCVGTAREAAPARTPR